MCSLLKGLLRWPPTPCATVKLLLTCWLSWMNAEISVPQKNKTFHVFLNQTGKLQFPLNPNSEKRHFRKSKMASLQPFVWVLLNRFFLCDLSYLNMRHVPSDPKCTQAAPAVPKDTQGAARSAKGALPERWSKETCLEMGHWATCGFVALVLILVLSLLWFHQCTYTLWAYRHLNSYFSASLKAKAFTISHRGYNSKTIGCTSLAWYYQHIEGKSNDSNLKECSFKNF